MRNKWLLNTDHICTLALWININIKPEDRYEGLQTKNAMDFLKEMSYENAKSTQVHNQNIDEYQTDEWVNSIVEENIAAFDKVSKANYHQKLHPAEILRMTECADTCCDQAPYYELTKTHKLLENAKYYCSNIIIDSILNQMEYEMPNYKPVRFEMKIDKLTLEARDSIPTIQLNTTQKIEKEPTEEVPDINLGR